MGEVVRYTLDEALSTIGFGKFQGLVLAYAGLGWVAEAMEMMLLSFVGPALETEWGLSSGQKSLISTVVFAGMLFGAYSSGLVSDSYGRRKAFLGAAIVTSGAGFLSAFSPNYATLVTLRGLVGIGLGSGHVFTSWFLEFVPTPNRGTWMVIFSSFWTVGSIFESSLAWIVMPRLGWRWLLVLSAVPSFLIVLFYGLTPESPRFLVMKGRTKEATNILENGALLNHKKLPLGILVSNDHFPMIELNEDTTHLISPTKKKPNNSSTLTIFSSKLIKTTLLLWFLYFGNTFSYYGIVLLTSELSGDKSKCDGSTSLSSGNTNDATSLYINVFITTLAEVPGIVLSAIIVDRIGRKLSMEIMFVLGFIFLLPLVTTQNAILITASLFGARMFISATFTVACIYAPEVYPTNVRATGVGIATAAGRVGGMVCPVIAVGLVSGCYQTAAVLVFQLIILLSALSVLFFPFETKGRQLTDDVIDHL